MSLTIGVLAFVIASSAAQQQPATDAPPVSIDRIRKVLSQPQTINPDAVPVFRVQVLGRNPNLEDLLGKQFWDGPARPTPGGAPLTHHELFAMITPAEFRGTAMYTQGEAMTMMAISIVGEWAIRKVMQRLEKAIRRSREAKKVRARDEAQKEVEEALAALGRTRAVGLLPRVPLF